MPKTAKTLNLGWALSLSVSCAPQTV